MKTIISVLAVFAIFAGVAVAQKGPNRGPGPGPRFDLIDRNSDGFIDKNEWQLHFQDIDTDRDGKLSREEMQEHRQQLGRNRN